MALYTLTDNNVIRNSFLEKHLFYISFLIFFYFHHHACVHPLMNHIKRFKFFEGKKPVKRMFSLKFNFFLYYLSSVPLLITLLFEKVFREKTFHKNYFSWKMIFIFFINPVYPVENLYQIFQKIDHFQSDSLLKKSKQTLNRIFFLSSLLCTRTDNSIIQKNISEKDFSLKFFSWNIPFLQHSWLTPLIFLPNHSKYVFHEINFL